MSAPGCVRETVDDKRLAGGRRLCKYFISALCFHFHKRDLDTLGNRLVVPRSMMEEPTPFFSQAYRPLSLGRRLLSNKMKRRAQSTYALFNAYAVVTYPDFSTQSIKQFR